MNEKNNPNQSPDVDISTKEPSLYSVFLLNDDFTTQEFVVSILTQFFYKSNSNAFKLMLEVHQNGRANVGVFTKEIAETKIYLVHQAAKRNNFPLKCIMEES